MTSPTQSEGGLKLRVSDLTVRSGSGRSILHVARATVSPGEAVVIRGPSGAGKTTFLYAIAGQLPISAGRVCWGDTDLATMRDRARTTFRRQHMGFVFQDHHLFEELSADKNASLAAAYSPKSDRAALRASAVDQLARLGLASHRDRAIATFSGGERQRVAVARALAGNPAIILADEPTASLDRSAADKLIDDLIGLARSDGRTLIAVTHDTHFQERADRVLDVVDGVLQPEGEDENG